MAIREIKRFGDPVLRKSAREVTDINGHVKNILDDMWETMREANGVGLAGNQIGVLRRLVTIEVDGGEYELINPKILEAEGDAELLEGCLSHPGEYGIVSRPDRVVVWALDREGKERTYEGTGILAQAFCHEIDHLDGVIYTDIMIREATEEDFPENEEDGEEEKEC